MKDEKQEIIMLPIPVETKQVPNQLSLYNEDEIREARNSTIYKSNQLIQKTRYDLSLTDQKILTFILSKINPYMEELPEITFTIQEFLILCGADFKNGKNYIRVRNSIKNIADESFWLTVVDDKGEEQDKLVRWFSDVTIKKQSGKVTVVLHEIMASLLLNLDTYTKFAQLCILPMKSKYSPRIYELLKSFSNQGIVKKSVNSLRRMLELSETKYVNWNDFNRYVLKIAVKEINQYTDIYVEHYPVREGRVVEYVTFTIRKKNAVQNVEAWAAAEKVLESKVSP